MSLSETLSRFILKKDWIRADNTVRWNAFSPGRNGETSVFRTSGISDREIWDIGNREVAAIQRKLLLGRADITAFTVNKNGLEVMPQEPPERHANIVGWPEEREAQKQIAMELAAEAQLTTAHMSM
jgi:hypothetical protein